MARMLFIAPLYAALLLSTACATNARSEGDDLYRRLGGGAGVTTLVETFILHIAADDRINHYFIDSDIERFRDKLSEQICELSGGPCSYSGDTMKLSHAGMQVDHAAFNALVEDLIETMSDLGIETGAQNRLLVLLAPMHADIIEP